MAFLILFGLGWGFFDCNNMPILCQIVRPELRATGYGVMNLVSISCGGLADWGFGIMRDRQVPLFGIFGVFASAAVLSTFLVLLIRPRETESAPSLAGSESDSWGILAMQPIEWLHEYVPAAHSPFHADGSLAPEVVAAQAAFLAANGIRTVFITGSTGECHSLTCAERLTLYEAWAAAGTAARRRGDRARRRQFDRGRPGAGAARARARAVGHQRAGAVVLQARDACRR